MTGIVTGSITDERDYRVVDVFTDRAYAGNPLAVTLEAKVCRRNGCSRSRASSTPRRRRSYCPRQWSTRRTASASSPPGAELPFAGHPSIGTAWVLADLGRISPGPVVQECSAGLMPVDVDADCATLTGGEPVAGDPLDEEPLLTALRLTAADFAGTAVRLFGCWLVWAYLHVRADAVARVRVNVAALAELPGAGVYVFSLDGDGAHARSLAAGLGRQLHSVMMVQVNPHRADARQRHLPRPYRSSRLRRAATCSLWGDGHASGRTARTSCSGRPRTRSRGVSSRTSHEDATKVCGANIAA